MAVRRLLRIRSIPLRSPCACVCRGKPRPFAHPSGLYSGASPGRGCHAVFGLECIARLARKDLDARARTTPSSARRFSALLCARSSAPLRHFVAYIFGRAHLRPTATALRAECASLNRVPCVTVPPRPTSSGSVQFPTCHPRSGLRSQFAANSRDYPSAITIALMPPPTHYGTYCSSSSYSPPESKGFDGVLVQPAAPVTSWHNSSSQQFVPTDSAPPAPSSTVAYLNTVSFAFESLRPHPSSLDARRYGFVSFRRRQNYEYY